MTVTVNGEPREIQRARNVRELLDELALPIHALLIEHNGVALRSKEWSGAKLSDADRLEFIRIVAGG